jgi:predicted DCC family thiol-disulfide oxidoreductase YuxK
MTDYTGFPIILFDGYCNLCSKSVQFILKRDKKGIFRFLPLQSERIILIKENYSFDQGNPESVILIDGGKVFKRSDAVLRIIKRLNFPWSLLWGLIIFPRFIRDPIYSWVAKNRFRWYGKRKSCFLPDFDRKDRFI